MPNTLFKYSLLPSVTLALSGMGDSFLYAYLPINYKELGLSLFEVGVILSVNRFVWRFPAQSIKSSSFILKEITAYAFWRDIGAAIGIVAGALLLDFLYLHVVFMIAAIPLSIFSLIDFIYFKRKLTYHEIR